MLHLRLDPASKFWVAATRCRRRLCFDTSPGYSHNALVLSIAQYRFISSSMACSSSPQQSSNAAADAFQLLSSVAQDVSAEDALYEEQVADIQRWWQSERFTGIRRTYTARDIASKRGTQQIAYPSSIMATKLFLLLRERSKNFEPIHTRTLSLHHQGNWF